MYRLDYIYFFKNIIKLMMINVCGAGIARGCGWQKIGAIVNLASFYLIGIPLGIVLAFVFHLGGKVLYI